MKRIVQQQDETQLVSVDEANKYRIICYSNMNTLGVVVHEPDEGICNVYVQWVNGHRTASAKTFKQLFQDLKTHVKFYEL